MKKEARVLLLKAQDSLLLSINQFNSAWDRGRTAAVLILLDHAFEMLLKAAIVHRNGRIRRPRQKQTIGFDECVRKGVSDSQVKFLSEEEALLLQIINGLRDSAQHYILDVSEGTLYLHAQAAVSLFRKLLHTVFGKELANELPERVLPVSTRPPSDLIALFDREAGEILSLLKPGVRRRFDASSRLRAFAIVEGALQGKREQPGVAELNRVATALSKGVAWRDVFSGIAAVNISPSDDGQVFQLRVTKKEGPPVHLVPEGTPDATVVAVKRVNDFDFYSMYHKDLSQKLGINSSRTSAAIWYLKVKENVDFYKEFKAKSILLKKYSDLALDHLKKELPRLDMDVVWNAYKSR